MSLGTMLLRSYLITLVIELPIGLLWKLRDPKDLLLLVCVNTMTNPPVVLLSFFFSISMPLDQSRFCLLILEVMVFIVEAKMYESWFPEIRRPWLYSLTANCASFFGGILISYCLFYF